MVRTLIVQGDCLCTPWVFLKLEKEEREKFSVLLSDYLNGLAGVRDFEACPTVVIAEITTVEYRVEGKSISFLLAYNSGAKVFYQLQYKIQDSPLFYKAILMSADEE